MKAYELLVSIIFDNSKAQLHYFRDLNDAIDTIGGQIICGNIEENTEYLCMCEPFDNGEICEAVFNHYGDFTYCYKVEFDDN